MEGGGVGEANYGSVGEESDPLLFWRPEGFGRARAGHGGLAGPTVGAHVERL